MQVDDSHPSSDTSRPDDPLVMSVLEEKKTLNSPKDTPPSIDEENEQASTNIETISEAGHPIIADVQTTKDSLEQQDDHQNAEHLTFRVKNPIGRFTKSILVH